MTEKKLTDVDKREPSADPGADPATGPVTDPVAERAMKTLSEKKQPKRRKAEPPKKEWKLPAFLKPKYKEVVPAEGLRDMISGAMAVIFYLMFAAFSWYVVYLKSLAFLTGEDTGIPGNPEVIPAKMIEPAVWSAVWVMAAIAAYAFFFANPDRRLGHAGERLSRQDLRGKRLRRRGHVWTLPWWIQMVLLFAFSWYIRMKVIELIGHDTIQIVDFERVFYVSLQDAPVFADVQGINFYQAFPNWALHVKLLHLLNINFGGTPLTGIMCNAVVSSLSVVLLYLVVYFATNKDAFAVISALIFSCWPFYLYYMILLTPDFNFVFLCLLGLLLIVVSYRFIKRLWLKACFYGAAGIVLSLAGFFKSVDKILIIALFIAAVLGAIACGRFHSKRVLSGLLVVVVFFTAWAGTSKLTYKMIEGYVGGPVNTNVAPYFMNVGMSVDTYGQWSQEVLDEYLGDIKETDYNFSLVNTRMKNRLDGRVQEVKDKLKADEELVQEWKEEGGKRPEGTPKSKWDFFDVKLQKAWANNEGIRFIMQTINKENPLYDTEFYDAYYAQIQAYQVVVAFLMTVGALAALLMRDRKAVLVCALMVFGFALLLLLSEVQPRYKTVVFPFMSVVAAYGIYAVIRPVQLMISTGLDRLMAGKLAKKAEIKKDEQKSTDLQ